MKMLKRSACAVLPLVLKGTWYDMIERGEKREEYRDPSEYWRRRLCSWNRRSTPHVPPVVEFRRGYAKDAPRMAFWCLTSSIAPHALYYGFMARREHPEWGEPSTPHFVIRLGDRVALAEAPDGAGAAKPGCCGNVEERTPEKGHKAAPRPMTWREVPHSPLPFRDGGAGVFVAANGQVPFTIKPFERPNEDPGEVYGRFNGDYHYMLCAINCHEALVEAAKKLLVLLEGRGEDTKELRALVARAEEHFE